MESRIVQVISKEIIKPSSQTPQHLKKYKLSLLDQLQSTWYIPLILFYNSCEQATEKTSLKIKQSLSNTLTTFYPLAGKFDQENLTVDCVDAGVNYVEARAYNARLSDYYERNCEIGDLRHYLPVVPLGGLTDDGVLLHVQVTFFECGGYALGVCLWHQVADVASLVLFLNSWAAVCRGKPLDQKPCFDLADYFPVQDLSSTGIGKLLAIFNKTITSEAPKTLVTKRVVFDKEKLAQLRVSLEENVVVKGPTRVELVLAFIWKCFILMAKAQDSKKSSFIATLAVNIRTRIVPPPTLEHVFGNACMIRPVFTELDEGDVPEYQDLVSKIRTTVTRVSDEYMMIQSLDNDKGFLAELDNFMNLILKGGVDQICGTSSWCRFPVYDVDYGWGEPVWVATTGLFKNAIILLDTKSGDGIEAWITLPPLNAATLLETICDMQPH